MITFKNYDVIPFDWTGSCFVTDSGCHCWFGNGRLHRLDGPARIYDGSNVGEYFINGKYYSFDKRINYWNHPLVLEHRMNKILEL